VSIYTFFLLLGPRLHALGKSRGYLTVSEFVFDRYARYVHMKIGTCKNM
jgi:Na+/proline symporter